MRHLLVLVFGLGLMASVAGRADADPTTALKWSTIGSGCVPQNPSITGGLYQNVNGAIQTTSSATVTVYCPVQETLWDLEEGVNSAPNTLQLTCAGAGGPVFRGMSATLIGIDESTGIETSYMPMPLDCGTSATVQRRVGALSSPIVFNDTTYYYVKVVMYPSYLGGTYPWKLYGVALKNLPIIP